MARFRFASGVLVLLVSTPVWAALQLTVTPAAPWETQAVTVRVADSFPSSCYSVCDAAGVWVTPTHFHIDWSIRNSGGFCLPVITNRFTDVSVGALAPGSYLVTAVEKVTAAGGECPSAAQTQSTQIGFVVYPRCDFDRDGDVGMEELQTFVAVLLGEDGDPTHVAAADMNGDGAADGEDIAAFVACLTVS